MRYPITVRLGDARHDVFLEASGSGRVADLSAALGAHLGAAAHAALSIEGGPPLRPETGLTEAGVRAGSVLRIHTGAAPVSPRLRLRVIEGPDSGLVVPLPRVGTVTIGRSADNEVHLAAHAVSRRHASLRMDEASAVLADTDSANGSMVDGDRITRPTPVSASSAIQIGADRIVIEDAPADAGQLPAGRHLSRLTDGTVRFARPHRYHAPAPVTVVRAPTAAEATRSPSGPVSVGAAGGLLVGVIGYLVLHNLSFLLFSLVSTLTLVASGGYGWWRSRQRSGRSARDHEAEVADHAAHVARLLAAEREIRLAESPGVASAVAVAATNASNLWERRPGHDDFLRLRLGTARLPSRLLVHAPDPEPRPLDGVPLTVDLPAAGTIGLSGPHGSARGLARWLLAQAVVQAGPADLTVAVLAADSDEPSAAWDWLRWLPHARPHSGALARVGTDPATTAALIEELSGVIASRRRSSRGGPRGFGHCWIVVVDDMAEHDVPGLADVLSDGPEVGVYVIAVGRLPYRCPITVTFTDEVRVHVRQPSGDTTQVIADVLHAAVAEQLGRSLAPLSDPEQRSGQAAVPTEVSLLDLLPIAGEATLLAKRWEREPRDTRTMLGADAGGPVVVDIAESGPHLLVAGATGWGKSALLQSLVAGLAAVNRPDQMGFILVDFKGGAAFTALGGLPHVVDTITNLDGHEVMRALDSLAGEMERRQVHLRTAGVEKLEEYQARSDAGTLPPGCPATLPRLLLVIDEFAKLRDELPPEIVGRLIDVATQGRSLGLQLVIGTQTPRGSVPAEIRPNVNLHVALHLTDEHSVDVVGVPDASALSVRGRAIMRRGDEAELTTFQSAYLGGVREASAPPVQVIPVPWHRLGQPPAAPAGATARDIDLLVDAVTEAALAGGLRGPERPWLRPLPAVIPVASLDRPEPGAVTLAYGREDLPELRSQPTIQWDLDHGTHLLAAGRPKSGRTTLLRTLAGAAAGYPVDALTLFVMDYGGDLGDLAELPHCGAVIGRSEGYRAARLLDYLEELIAARTAGSHRTVVMIDDWDTWVAAIGEQDSYGRFDQLLRIAQKGPGAGIHLAVTGTSALLTGHGARGRQLVETATDRLVLPFDRTEYGYLSVPSTAIPTMPRSGQAVRVGARWRTLQVAVVGDSPDSTAQVAAIHALAARIPPGDGVHRIEALPQWITWSSARRRPPAEPGAIAPADALPIGVGGDSAGLVTVDRDGPWSRIAVSGEPRSGRSNLLLALALDRLAAHERVIAFALGRTSPLRGLSGAAVVLSVPSPTPRQAQLALASAGSRPHVLLVDDAELVVRTEVDAVLRDHLRRAGARVTTVVVSSAPEHLMLPPSNGFLAEATRGAGAVLLNPGMARVQLLGAAVRLPDAFVGSAVPGRAVLIAGGRSTQVQVPLVEEADIIGGSPSRTVALLSLTDALGREASGVEALSAIVDELRAAGVDDLTDAALARAVTLARDWTGSAAKLVEAVSAES